MGFGMESVIKVKCDKVGRMIPEELETAIQESQAQVNKSLNSIQSLNLNLSISILSLADLIHYVCDCLESGNFTSG